MAARAAALLDMVLRRADPAIGTAEDRSLSRRTAVKAATFVLGFVTDFRRVMRWFGWRELVRRECELARE